MRTRSILFILAFVALAVSTAFIIGSNDKEGKESCSETCSTASESSCSSTSTDKSRTADGVKAETIGEGYSIGDTATDFALRNVDGSKVSMANYPDAKGFVVIFTCNHCPYSVAYEDRLNDLYEFCEKVNYPLIAINPNNPKTYESDSFDNMVIRAKEKGFKFPYLMDEGQKIYPVYGATKTPHVYILNKEDDALKVRYIGAIDDNYEDEEEVEEAFVENALKALVNGKKVDPEVTKAIGCSIKK